MCSVMAESFSIERRKLMRFLGARVVLTNPAHKATGMVIKAKGKWVEYNKPSNFLFYEILDSTCAYLLIEFPFSWCSPPFSLCRVT